LSYLKNQGTKYLLSTPILTLGVCKIVILLMRYSSVATRLCLFCFFAMVSVAQASDPWDGPSFSASPEALRQAAALVKPEKDADATILLSDQQVRFDREGKAVEVYRTIYRIESQEGVKGWAETSADWEPWHQSKPEIRVRVLSPDGSVHTLDPKTLSDRPVHEGSPEVFSDNRAYGGPLPAIAVGAIVEEEAIIRDTSPFFPAGMTQRRVLVKGVLVQKTRITFSHPESLPFHFAIHLLPQAVVNKTVSNGEETIVIENGPIPGEPEHPTHVPSNVIASPQIDFATGVSWQQVADSYARLSEDKIRTADVRALATAASGKSAARIEVIRHLVAALHDAVRYTGVEFGESSLIPQFPSETLKRKYGDCKDKAAALVAMLRAVGIPAKLALLQTGPGRDINEDMPGMGMFDHAIVYLPPSGTDPELWIDATADYVQVGYLPMMDYGRHALIVDSATTGLKTIPEITSAQNFHRETREFKMAEFGLATITETNEWVGPKEGDYREFYAGEAKEVRKNSESYVKEMYLADSLISLQHGDVQDTTMPLSVSYVAKGRRGSTDLTSAVMAIRQEAMFEGFPNYFYEKEETAKDEDPEDKAKPRTVDWWIHPFATEWRYKVSAPVGFKLRALPTDKQQSLGSALYTQKYTANPEGTMVEAVLRFESGKPRLTPAEAKAFRDEIIKARAAEPILISFDNVAYSLMSAGKIKEALIACRQIASLHPQEALHRVQLANILLTAGLGEQARAAAREATVLDPKSALAFSTLGRTLQHDLIGRSLKKGFDLAGAVSAYRKAKELDPKDKDVRVALAGLLEYDEEGTRYGAKASLQDAANEIQELKKLDENFARSYDDNYLYDLWYAGKFKDVAERATTLPGSDIRKAFILGTTAVEKGPEAALRQALEITTEDASRGRSLTTAGYLLMYIHHYAEAAELLSAGARGNANEGALLNFAAILKKTKSASEIKIDSGDPSGAVQRVFALLFSKKADYEQVASVMSKNVVLGSGENSDKEEFAKGMFVMRSQLTASGMPLRVVSDIFLSNVRFTKEGDDAAGYRIAMQSPGAEAQDVFVTREDGQYKIADFGLNGGPPENIGWEVLARADKKDLAGARKWLDWAREKIHMNSGDDPLAGQPFPHFWTKGQEGDETAIRTAGLILLPSKHLKQQHLAELLRLRDSAKSVQDRKLLNLVLAYGYAAQDQWKELAPVAEELVKSEPESFLAFGFAAGVYAHSKNYDEWEKQLQARLQKHPDEIGYVRSAASLAMNRGDVRKSRELIKGLMDRGKATTSDLNSYSWRALYLSSATDQESIEAAERANDLSRKSNFSILHTLACVYAAAGKPGLGRETLLKAMDAGKLEEADASVWLAYGKIAQEYGEADAARMMFAKVEKPKVDNPDSNFQLAQHWLQTLPPPTASSPKTAR